MTFTPDPRAYQQLVFGGATRTVDCSAWSGAYETAAATANAIHLTGRQIRLASDEPIPDRSSPGLNVDQVDAAVYKLTHGAVNFDTHHPTRASYQSLVVDGRFVHTSVKRSILVDRGFGGSNGFRGAHAIVVHARAIDNLPVIFDPLVPYHIVSTWDAVLDAAQAIYNGSTIFASFTRDLTPDYAVSIKPRKGYDLVSFVRYTLDDAGRIVSRTRHNTRGFVATSTPPKWHGGTGRIGGRVLTQLTSGARKGWWVSGKWAHEVIP